MLALLLRSDGAAGTPIDKKIWMYNRVTSVRSVEKLYSELVLLP